MSKDLAGIVDKYIMPIETDVGPSTSEDGAVQSEELGLLGCFKSIFSCCCSSEGE